jgi:uncharacterized membrane protein (DUF106 family)
MLVVDDRYHGTQKMTMMKRMMCFLKKKMKRMMCSSRNTSMCFRLQQQQKKTSMHKVISSDFRVTLYGENFLKG